MRVLSPQTIAPPLANYAHGIEIPAGARIVRTAGQLAVAPDGSIPAGVGAQTSRCFDNIAAILAEAGMSLSDIVHVTAYLTDRAHLADYMHARDAALAGNPRLASSTLLIISGFSRPEFLVEVEVWAASHRVAEP